VLLSCGVTFVMPGGKRSQGQLLLFNHWLIFTPYASSGQKDLVVPVEEIQHISRLRETLTVDRTGRGGSGTESPANLLHQSNSARERGSGRKAENSLKVRASLGLHSRNNSRNNNQFPTDEITTTKRQHQISEATTDGSSQGAKTEAKSGGEARGGESPPISWRQRRNSKSASFEGSGKLSSTSQEDVEDREFDDPPAGNPLISQSSFYGSEVGDNEGWHPLRLSHEGRGWSMGARGEHSFHQSPIAVRAESVRDADPSRPVSLTRRKSQISKFRRSMDRRDAMDENTGRMHFFQFKDSGSSLAMQARLSKQMEVVKEERSCRLDDLDTISVLRHFRFLLDGDNLSQAEMHRLETLAGHAYRHTFKAGDVIVNQGNGANCLYHVLQGIVAVYDNDSVVAMRHKGEVAAERFFLGKGNTGMPVRIVAETEVVIWRIEYQEVEELAAAMPGVGTCIFRSVVTQLARRIQTMMVQLSSTVLEDSSSSTLLREGESGGVAQVEGGEQTATPGQYSADSA